MFWIAEVPPFSLLRSGSKVKDVTLHIALEVTLCWWPLLVAQHLPKLSESCASCPLFEADLEVSLCLPVVGREQISLGTTVHSHPLFFGHIAVFAIKDVEPDSFRFSFLPNRLSVSPPVTLKIALFSRRLVSFGTRFSWA